jgi:hypothetical protein
MTTVTITYKAFSNNNDRPITSATIEVGYPFVYEYPYNANQTQQQDIKLCDVLYHQTNIYEGSLWNLLEPVLPTNRTHTALSVGDEVTITDTDNTRTYRCADIGWELLTEKVGA